MTRHARVGPYAKADTKCAAPTSTESYSFAINAGELVHDPLRAGGVVGTEGAISSPSSTGFVNRTTGKAELRFTAPGSYVAPGRVVQKFRITRRVVFG